MTTTAPAAHVPRATEHDAGSADRGRAPLYVRALPVLLVALATLLLVADGAHWGHLVSDASFVVFPLLAATSCSHRARRRRGADGRAWTWFATSMWVWTAGGVAWCASELLLGGHPFPSVADLGFVGYALPAIAGLLCLPSTGGSRLAKGVLVLDAVVIALGVLFVSWVTVLRDTYAAPADSVVERLVLVAYPVGDLLLVAFVLATSVRVRAGGRAALAVLGAGFVALSVFDSAYIRLVVDGRYQPGTLLDLGWAVAFSLIAAAPHVAELEAPTRHRLTAGQQLVPYAVILVVVAFALPQGITPRTEPFLFGAAVVFTVAAGGRQVLVVVQKNHLADALERQVVSASSELDVEREFLRAVMDNLQAGVIACDANGRLSFHNPATALLHDDPDETRREQWHTDLWTSDGTRRLGQDELPLKRALVGEDVTDVEFLIWPPGTTARTLTASGRALHDASGATVGAVVAMHDITERKRTEGLLVERALTDHVTGLGNRQRFRDEVESLMRQRREVAVLLLDLDDFKNVNDSLGHHAGDLCLMQTAERLAASVPAGTSVCRLGGDEFAVLVPDPQPVQVVELASAVLSAVGAPATLVGAEVRTTASIGIASTGAQITSGSDLLKAADLAMYLAKSLGKGRYALYEEHLQQSAVDRLALASDVRNALDAEEFHLVYQPIVDLTTGRMNAVEALLRWTHPVRGSVSPAEFIPIAEQAGLIVEIGAWVLRQACAQLLDWDANGGDTAFRITVNVSTRQLDRRELLAVLDECLAAGVDPGRVVLEITETALTLDDATSMEILHAIRNRGVHLAIDDFGTGYSSLSRLRSAPVSRLKVDRSFIAEIDGATADVPIVDATMAMARGLGLGVVAEGIETVEQLAYLRQAGCPEAQGFLLSKPLTADTIPALMHGDAPWAQLLAVPADAVADGNDGFRHLLELAVDPHADLDQLLRPLLTELKQVTGLTMTYLTRVDSTAGEQHISFVEAATPGPVSEGLVVPWADTLCKRALEKGPRRTSDARTDYPDTDVPAELGLSSYIVEPVHRPDGELYGTLCGASTHARELSEADSATLRMFARLVEQKLDQPKGAQRVDAPDSWSAGGQNEPAPRGDVMAIVSRRARAQDLWEQARTRRADVAQRMLHDGRVDEGRRTLKKLEEVHKAFTAQLTVLDTGPRRHSRARRVVLADDQMLIRQLVGVVLAELDNVVVVGEADSGAATIGVVLAEQPDILLLDYDLGDCVADDILDDLRMLSPGTRILLHSARPDVHQLGQRLNVDRVVPKAADVDVLVDAIQALAGRHRPAPGEPSSFGSEPTATTNTVHRQVHGVADVFTDRRAEGEGFEPSRSVSP